MKNLKKVLSLVLALSMALSLMTVAFAADASDFKDYNEVKYDEAVDVMVAAGVFNGKDGNKFAPNDTLTREEAAKIVTYMMMGQKEADKLTTTVAPYADVAANRWSAGAIAWCTEKGILTGSNGKFYPTGKLTGLAFSKMLLVAMGYDAKIEKLEGNSWAINSATLAINNDLDKGMEKVSLSGNLTREQAAQMAFNAMKADLVDYENRGTEIKLSDGTTVIVGASKAATVENKDKDKDTIAKDAVLQFAEKYCRDLSKVVGTSEDDFGRPAVEWKYDKKSVGTYADEADYSYDGEVTRADLYGDVGKSIVEDLEDSTEAKAKLTVYSDGEKKVTDAKSGIKNFFDKNNTKSIGANSDLTGNGTRTEVYVDDDNAVTIVIINTYLVKATDDYNTKKETVAIEAVGTNAAPIKASTISSEDFNVSDVKEDDYLLITAAGSAASNKEIKSVEPAEVVTGTVNSYSAGKNVTVAGTKYEYAFKADTGSTNGTKVAYEIGEDTTIVTDKNGYILYVDEVTVAADKYVYISEIAEKGDFANSKTFVADAYFLDGTHKTIDVKDKYSNNDAVSKVTTGAWYAYSVNSSDKYTLTKLTAGNAENNTGSVKVSGTATLVENGKVSVGGSESGNIKANASTIFVVVDDDDVVTAYTGIAKVPTIKAKNADLTATYVLAKNASYAKYVFIDAGKASIDGATSASGDFIYLLKYDSTNKDSDKNDYYTYKAIVNGEEKTVNLGENFNASTTCNKLYTDVKYDDKGYVDSMNEVDANDDYTKVAEALTDASVEYADGVLTIAGTDFVVDSKINIYLIAADTNVKEDAGADYEVSANISANSLYTTLKEYNTRIDGTYYAQVNDDTDTLTNLYIYVNATV